MQSNASSADGGGHWEIQGTVPTARVSPQYRLATALVALVMVLLPVIYLGIIVATGWWIYDYAMEGPAQTSGRRGSSSGSLVMYITPLVVGAIVILFMIKPLFHRRQKSA